eukprot:PhM_4_TR9147/c0_g1_i1/m.90237
MFRQNPSTRRLLLYCHQSSLFSSHIPPAHESCTSSKASDATATALEPTSYLDALLESEFFGSPNNNNNNNKVPYASSSSFFSNPTTCHDLTARLAKYTSSSYHSNIPSNHATSYAACAVELLCSSSSSSDMTDVRKMILSFARHSELFQPFRTCILDNKNNGIDALTTLERLLLREMINSNKKISHDKVKNSNMDGYESSWSGDDGAMGAGDCYTLFLSVANAISYLGLAEELLHTNLALHDAAEEVVTSNIVHNNNSNNNNNNNSAHTAAIVNLVSVFGAPERLLEIVSKHVVVSALNKTIPEQQAFSYALKLLELAVFGRRTFTPVCDVLVAFLTDQQRQQRTVSLKESIRLLSIISDLSFKWDYGTNIHPSITYKLASVVGNAFSKMTDWETSSSEGITLSDVVNVHCAGSVLAFPSLCAHTRALLTERVSGILSQPGSLAKLATTAIATDDRTNNVCFCAEFNSELASLSIKKDQCGDINDAAVLAGMVRVGAPLVLIDFSSKELTRVPLLLAARSLLSRGPSQDDDDDAALTTVMRRVVHESIAEHRHTASLHKELMSGYPQYSDMYKCVCKEERARSAKVRRMVSSSSSSTGRHHSGGDARVLSWRQALMFWRQASRRK